MLSENEEKFMKEELVTGDFNEYLVEFLKDPKEARAYLNSALEEEDFRVFLLALRNVADAFGISNLAAEADLNRENIYRMLSNKGNPKLSSIIAVLRAIGIRLKTEILESDIFEEEEMYEEYTETVFEVKASVYPKNPKPQSNRFEYEFAGTTRISNPSSFFTLKRNQELAFTA